MKPPGWPGAFPGPKYAGAQVPSAGFSSLTKTPRYFTAGLPWVKRPGFTHTWSRRAGGTSSHQCHGETPMP
ncbi:hypothetical protein GCM10018980_10160 [Streptomyces capoamus]|uniref:Uncharacterized protein n=1 Tax=Streptomyces capoamus TaxID=68183 RepID=A0A919C285_9ACTN|nr:hypothetical protein GCM10018980_10160 [Streptomyces capoamus]